jgi:hypothetical protein
MSLSEESSEAQPILHKKKDFIWEDLRTIFVPNSKDECNENELLLANDYFLFFIEPSEKLINYFNNSKDKNNKRMFYLLNNKIETKEYRYIGAYYQMTQIFKNLFNKIRQTDIKFNNSKHITLTNKIMRKCAAFMFEYANKYRNKIVIII